jgi:hypothetical protein
MFINTMALKSSDKWMFTLYTSIILVVLFNHYAFKLTNSLLGGLVGALADKNGCPTIIGFVVHVIVFTLVLRFSMDLGR